MINENPHIVAGVIKAYEKYKVHPYLTLMWAVNYAENFGHVYGSCQTPKSFLNLEKCLILHDFLHEKIKTNSFGADKYFKEAKGTYLTQKIISLSQATSPELFKAIEKNDLKKIKNLIASFK
jgi:hypothetical protein